MIDLVAWTKGAIEKADSGESKLTQEVYEIEGLSSPKVRRLLNNLCAFPSVSYLEIGSWKGSTLISAAYKNVGVFCGIDNHRKRFGEDRSPRIDFDANRKRFAGEAHFRFFGEDSWRFDVSKIKTPVNIYFYDGDHTPEGTERAFTHFDPILAPTFVLVMDDWNRHRIRAATLSTILSMRYHVMYSRDLFTPGYANDDRENPTSWWNGLHVAVLRKHDAGDSQS